MAKFTLTIETDNAAFEGDNLYPEIARILRAIATDVQENDGGCGRARDVNGNTVARFEFDGD